MKQAFYINSVKRVMQMVTVITAISFLLTSCSDEAVEAEIPTTELQTSQENGAIIPGKYIIVFKEGESLRINPKATNAERTDLVRELSEDIFSKNTISKAKMSQVFGSSILGVVAELSDAEVTRLKKDFRVAYVEPDRIITLYRPIPIPGGITIPNSQAVPYGVSRVGYASGAGKTAWIIDTGVDLDHPDLNVDVSRSMSVFNSWFDATPDDNNGHGTHVAGIVAAKDNRVGVVGVAHDATVVAVKVLNWNGSGTYSGVIAGINYVATNGKAGDVANLSLGGPVSEALDDAVLAAAEKGIFFAIAAGNDGKDANNYSPARVNHPNVFTVSAMDASERLADFSNYGNPPIDFCAPGVNIRSAWRYGMYNTISGTSMAAPHVAGILLLRGKAPATDGFVKNDPDGSPDPIAHSFDKK